MTNNARNLSTNQHELLRCARCSVTQGKPVVFEYLRDLVRHVVDFHPHRLEQFFAHVPLEQAVAMLLATLVDAETGRPKQ